MTEIYFDNSATTKVSEEAAAAALKAMQEGYGNASSLHGKGLLAARALTKARRTMATILGTSEKEIIFNSSASEGNNTVLSGMAAAHSKKGGRILVSAVEHPSVLEPAKILAQKGFAVQTVAVDKWGRLDLADLASKLTADTILVSCQHTNNETGVRQPVEKIGELVKRSSQAFFHIDGVQGFAKLPLDLAACRADFYTASGHKIHAPKGVGLLWIKNGLRLPPLIYGGGQERNQRSGTENIPGIEAFAIAAWAAATKRASNLTAVQQVRDTLWLKLRELLPDVICNSDMAGDASPYVLNVGFPGAKSEVLLHYLEERKIYVSAGSACHSSKNKTSHVLLAMKVPQELADCSIRYSFCPQNTVIEAQIVAETTAEIVKEIRRYRVGEKQRNRR